MTLADFANQPMPEVTWHLVSRIAAKAVEAQTDEMFHHAHGVMKQTLRIAGVVEVELGEILPHHSLTAVLARRVEDMPVLIAYEPFRVFTSQWRINRRVIDHQVGHELQTGRVAFGHGL